MKYAPAGDIKDLKSGKKEYHEKKISTSETKGLRKFKVAITWIIVIAFIATSGVIIAGLGSGLGKTEDPRQDPAAADPTEQARKRLEADVDFWQGKIKEEPQNAQNYFNLGETYRNAGKDDEAVDSYKKAIEKDPRNVLAMKYLARVYRKKKYYCQALKLLTEASGIDAENAGLFEEMAILHYEKKETTQAIAAMKKALKLSPGETMYYAFLSRLLMEAGKKDDARKTINEGLEIAKARHDERGQAILTALMQAIENPPKEEPKEGGKKEAKDAKEPVKAPSGQKPGTPVEGKAEKAPASGK
jgi:tetratricopeptide (TPR) repeat protein